ncbi:MAG: PRC-barrel domain-containing protein, partial [Anaerolineales bacterium]|nr:PRC-barrel domain-containing protein [Anaerolineales bacterium]
MLYGKDLSGNPIVSVSNGEIIGHVKDLYTDKEMNAITGLYLGVKGLL